MNSLAETCPINAHGGLARWNQFKSVSADLMQGGVLWPTIKGQAGTLDKTNVTVSLRNEWASHSPFGAVGRSSRFGPNRCPIEATDGSVLDELRQPRQSFAGHTLQTPWTELQLAYFAGYAMGGSLKHTFSARLARCDL